MFIAAEHTYLPARSHPEDPLAAPPASVPRAQPPARI
jgi:hypothetical protein